MEQNDLSPRQVAGFGAVILLAGCYFALVGADLAPPPGGKDDLHAPLWVVFCAGLAFALAGLSLIVQGLGHASPVTGELPPGAPAWLQLLQTVLVLLVATCLASAGSWIAVGPGAREFNVSGPFVANGPVGASIGRAVFALGTVIVWIFVAALLVRCARLLRRGKN